MAAGEAVGVALLGCGTVGTGVAQALSGKEDAFTRYVGCPLRLVGVLVRDLGKARPGLPPEVPLTNRADDLISSPEVAIVIEAMGGEHPALEYIQSALRAGKHVVTANKEVMAKHGPEVIALADENGATVSFEASVGGGIPIVGPLTHDLAANRVSAVNAIINGTTNYMLTRMAQEGVSYEEALAAALDLGYAEADPSDDVDGTDAAYKIAILSSLAFRCTVHEADVFREGIRRLDPVDFIYARELGYVIKLLATSRLVDGAVQARVHPAFISEHHPLAKVDDVYNAVELEGDLVGWAMFQGPGAGAQPTTSAVTGDVLAIARSVARGSAPSAYPEMQERRAIIPVAELETKYYLRLRAYDQPGVMARITGVLGELGVSLASVIQKEIPEDSDTPAEIVITTHKAREHAVQQAVQRLGDLDVVREVSNLVRIEDGSA